MKKAIFTFLFISSALVSFSQEQTPVEIARTYFTALFKKGDFETLQKILHPEAIYQQADGLPYGGKFVGFNNWMAMFGKAQSYFSITLASEPSYFYNEEQKIVIASFNVRLYKKDSQQEMTLPILEKLEIIAGKITKVQPFYFDTKKVVDFIKE